MKKTEDMIEDIGERCPHVARDDGHYDDAPADWWTSGFWPGMLWIVYDRTRIERFRAAAWEGDAKLERLFLEPNDFYHDVGFQFLPTAAAKHMITGDAEGKRRALAAAVFLAGRYNPAGRFIRAWNGADHTGWAIIDCCMNLSLLFWASRESGDPRFAHIAKAHADTVLDHFLRPDGSSRHIAVFDPLTGRFLRADGGQGFGPDSAWSRGQAWALYGLSNIYKHTGESKYLEAALRSAYHFLACLPEDSIPLWDFRLPDPDGQPRDTSAAAIAASGLLELAALTPAPIGRTFREGAVRILASLTERHSALDRDGYHALLTGGTGHVPENKNIHVSLIYGDYFYLEAIAKLTGWERRFF
ncbi:glycoside hydrolase family 88 protein [Cohnella caldifontis]|uniref:glycoside hydrolase family 88 protein n=1 Tax=Cohnella caldifontis TaxID=3027471 RepID=UPI0023EBF376|nr:glycoside hydrolase family 88 protein [Cohnella sp. YIM B05605]